MPFGGRGADAGSGSDPASHVIRSGPSVEEWQDEVVAWLGVDPPRVVGTVAGGAEAERHDGHDLVRVVHQERTAGIAEAGAAAAADRAWVVQRVDIAALRDVAVDLNDPRGRLVPGLDVLRLRLDRLDPIADRLDQGLV